jgi:hypothetical protein
MTEYTFKLSIAANPANEIQSDDWIAQNCHSGFRLQKVFTYLRCKAQDGVMVRYPGGEEDDYFLATLYDQTEAIHFKLRYGDFLLPTG